MRTSCLAALALVFAAAVGLAAEPLRLATFEVDASPPVGSPLAYDPTQEIEGPLSCRGVILWGAGQPIVLCAIDWIGIGNGSHREFREALAKAAETSVERVSLHALHQHDAPWCDADIDQLCQQYKLAQRPFDTPFARDVFRRAAAAVAQAKERAQPVTHLGAGSARVEQVASNRRILGPEGKVIHVRYSATKDAAVRAFPEGVIDPLVRILSFWNEDRPLVALTYYATHPQSYYRTGKANPDFPGLARQARQTATGVFHVHFNGAGGNVTAGKYNDGAPANRQVLAARLAQGLQQAWESTTRTPLAAADVRWESLAVALPPSPGLDEKTLLAQIEDADKPARQRFVAANKLAYLRRFQAGAKIDIAYLALGRAGVLHMPGELFVEYQLEAQRLKPGTFQCLAAYGDYGPAYIGTAIAYTQGGYETGVDASYVAPEAEAVLMQAIARLLHVDAAHLRPLR